MRIDWCAVPGRVEDDGVYGVQMGNEPHEFWCVFSLMLDGCALMRNQSRAAYWRDTFSPENPNQQLYLCVPAALKSISSVVKRVIYICHLPPPPQHFLYKMFGVSAASASTWSIWEMVHHLQNQGLIRGQYLSCQQVVVHYSDWSSIQFHDLGLHEACTCVLPDLLLCW